MNKDQLVNFIVKKETQVFAAMGSIDANSNGIVFVVDDEGCIAGAVSDGDIRRWLLKGGSLETPVYQLMKKDPIVLNEDERDKADSLMKQKFVNAIPIIDEARIIVDIKLIKDKEALLKKKQKSLVDVPVVIMAGGMGTRLYPYTKILPKPLIPIGEIPIVERVMDGFAEYGINHFYMTVNYKKNMIKSYFGEVEHSYCIDYVEEEKPLGTGGSIKLINEKFDKPLIIANCDSLIMAEYDDLYKHHLESGNSITIVTSLKKDTIPYGVVYSNEKGDLDHIDEKPTRSYLINTGMYIINPDMVELIPKEELFHMTHLIEKAKDNGYKIGMYPVGEDSFLDMGEFSEMKRMEEKLGER